MGKMNEQIAEVNLNEVLSVQTKENCSLQKIEKKNIFSVRNSPFDVSLRISTFISAKEFESFIKSTEKLVRVSFEYRLWISYIIDNLGQKECALTHENINECPIVVHHHPINLYTIVKTIINDFIKHGKEFSTFDIATKVIELHYQNNVGYIVLLSDLHEKFHSGFLKIPIELINGNYKYVFQNYQLEDEELQRIYEHCNIHIEDLKMEWSKGNYPGIISCK